MKAAKDAGRRGETAGPPDVAILTHLADCAACRETFEVASWMSRLAADTDAIAADRDLPDPARIWWRARLLQRWDAETRATAPLDVMQRFEVVGSVILAVVLLVTMWPDTGGFQHTAGAASSWWPALANLFAPSGLSTLVITAVLLLGLMAVFTVHQLMQED
jgi:hypothetical protein